MDAILPKLNESYRNIIEKNVMSTLIPKSPIKDEMTEKVKEFMKEYFNLRKTSIDPRRLKILRQNRELLVSKNIQENSENTDNLIVKMDDLNIDQIEKKVQKKKTVKFCLGE